jgi:hypothetical protein
MRKSLRVAMIATGVLVSIQICSYYLYGVDSLKADCFKHFRTHLTEKTGKVGIFLKEDLPLKSKEAITQQFLPPFSSVDFYTDSVSFEREFSQNPNDWGVRYEIEYYFPFSATVVEFNGGRSYAESWESEYFWCFGKWILIEKDCTGQS